MTSNTDRLRNARDVLLETREDYDRAVTTFSWPTITGPFCWATDWFDAIGRNNDQLALWIVDDAGRDTRLTYDALVRRSDQVATWLQSVGVGSGDKVLLMLGNRVELWETMLAVMKLGAVVLPTTTALGPVDLADRLTRADVRWVVTTLGEATKFDGLPGPRKICVDGTPHGWLDYRESEMVTAQTFQAITEPDDPLLLYFTSGTTSRPKLVQHTQLSYPVGHLSTMYWLGLQPGDIHMTIASPGWAKHAWSCFFAPFLAQATVFVHDYARFDPGILLEHLRAARVTTFCAPPTVWRMLIQADLSGGPGALRELLAAGEPLNPEVITRVREHWGLIVRDGFGQTETTAQIGNCPGQDVVYGAMGKPLPGVPVVLLDPVTGVETSREGELCLDLAVRPLNLMSGYQGDPERAAEAMAGGYYHTGDVATCDGDGLITYVGRTDDVFKSSDYKVSPFEVESALLEHPAVAEAAVVPAPDDVRLAVTKAYVTLAAGWEATEQTARAVLSHARATLAPHLRVRRLEFVVELPKTISGKIKRVDLRDREQELHRSGTLAEDEWRDDQLGLRT